MGESYGGHYVPIYAHQLLFESEHKEDWADLLKGIGIWNGWIDPEVQSANYSEIAY